MEKFISFSGGVESTTMCLLFGNEADAIFADTGFEHVKLYEHIEKVERYVKLHIRPSFKIVIVKRNGESLPEYIRSSKYYPSFQSRYCTRMFKIEPIDNYIKELGEVELMIGLNADEIEMRTGNHGNIKSVIYSYPLADKGINRKTCLYILHEVGLEPNYPAYMKRGGCKGCYFKSKKEFEAMAILEPDEYDEIADLEAEIQDVRDKFYHIVDSIPNLKHFKRHAQSILFKPEEIYPVKNDATKCGVFCAR